MDRITGIQISKRNEDGGKKKKKRAKVFEMRCCGAATAVQEMSL